MTAPTEPVEAALALVDATGVSEHWSACDDLRKYRIVKELPQMCAARILAAEVRRLRAELASQPMIATETHVLPPRK